MMSSLILFLPEPGLSWILVAAIIVLLFGGSKLPELAKSLGKSKKAFKEGLAEADAEADKDRKEVAGARQNSLSSVDDEALFEEARRRARLRVGEGAPEERK
jgi:sec-independent protein translocase protein TatA